MDEILKNALVGFVPAGMLICGSQIVFFRSKTTFTFFQVFGAGCLVGVVLTHVAEALGLFPWMNWGLPESAGHYLDLSCAVLGGTLFPVGYLLHAVAKRKTYSSGAGSNFP